MTARGKMAGHEVEFRDGQWRYEDGSVASPDRVCQSCHRSPEHCQVLIPADLSHTGTERWAVKPVDACIASLVNALNLAAIYTRSSCCGHGERSGQIMLQDGRMLIIEPSHEEYRKWQRAAEAPTVYSNPLEKG